jgi:geranylgeranyl diphosphate synthase type II
VQDEAMLTLLHRLKTGAMIAGAAELGCVAAEMNCKKRAQAVEYAAQLGLAFQIRDDMLDVVGDEEVFGKPIGSDREEGKVTFVDLRGLAGCAKLVDECTVRAKAAIADWPDHEFLFELADQMVGRIK